MGQLLGARQLRRSAAKPVGLRGGLGGAFEDDGVAEGFELADVVAAAAFGVGAGGVEPWADLLVVLRPGQHLAASFR
jgi:hypothetical protein